MATAPTKLWTVDDLDDLPDGRTEIWRGELVEMPAAGGMHSSLAIAVAASIYNFARASELGVVFGADGGFILSRDPTLLLIPDVAFVRRERMPDDDEGILELAPDLVIEVVSPTDRMTDVDEKVSVYLAAGVRMVWVVLPRRKIVHVYNSDEQGVIREVGAGEELDGGAVLPGFRLPLAEIFR